jgi:alpha-glucosidase (family GH31 glycosyl hydrolase)
MFGATRTGMPIQRALLLAYPHDPAVADLSDEYLYGSEILVAPVTEAGPPAHPDHPVMSARSVYFPAGRWFSFPDAKTVQTGSATATVSAAIDQIPVFVREGAIVPMGDIWRGNNRWTPHWTPRLSLEMYPWGSGRGRVASRFDYYDGSRVNTITMKPVGSGVQVEFGDLGTAGVIRLHCHRLDGVSLNGQRLAPGKGYRFDPVAEVALIPFDGRVKLKIQEISGL